MSAPRDLTATILRVLQRTADVQGNVTMLRAAENIAAELEARHVNDATVGRLAEIIASDAALVRVGQAEALRERRAEESEFHVEQLRDARDSAERRIERADALLDGWEHDGPDDPAILLLIQRVREVLVGSRGEVGTGAGEGATGQDTGTAWVTRSEDCPEAPAQAHLSAADDSDAALCPCGEPIGHAHHCGSCCGCGAADQHEHMAMVEHLRRCPICDMRFDKECAACGCGLDGYGNCPCGCYGWDRCDHDWLDRPESDSRECLICGVEVWSRSHSPPSTRR